jgi:hypothetical protein
MLKVPGPSSRLSESREKTSEPSSRGSMGKLGPLLERTLEDGPADRCGGVQAVRLTVEEIGIVEGKANENA